jgi:hypothetical protein
MSFRDGVIGFLLVVGVALALYSSHYRASLGNMAGVMTSFAIPIFFIVVGLAFFAGSRMLDFPDLKIALTVLVVLLFIGALFLTLGTDVSAALSGNFYKTDAAKTEQVKLQNVFFSTDLFSTSLLLVIGLSLFFTFFIKKKG